MAMRNKKTRSGAVFRGASPGGPGRPRLGSGCAILPYRMIVPGRSGGMGSWRGRWHWIVSILLCACAVIFGTLLYPLVLLFFSLIALAYPLFRRHTPDDPSSSGGAPPERSGA